MKNKIILVQEENIRIIFALSFKNSVTYTLFQIKNTCFDSHQCQFQALIKRVCIYLLIVSLGFFFRYTYLNFLYHHAHVHLFSILHSLQLWNIIHICYILSLRFVSFLCFNLIKIVIQGQGE